MSKQANPLAIGAFLVGGIFLLVSAVLLFGGGEYFKHKMRYVIFFDSALNGLNVGAAVKLQGVQIGTVSEVSLEMDTSSGRIYKPVVIEIDPEKLREFSVKDDHIQLGQLQQHYAQRLIELGLKARLETQSLLTGLLYVDFNFYPEKPIYLVNLKYKNLSELPSIPSTVDEIRNIADEVLNKVRELPLEEMVRDLSETFAESRDLLKAEDTKKAVKDLSLSLHETQKLMQTLNAQMGPLLTNVNTTVVDTRNSIKDMNNQLLPVLKAAEKSLNSATQVIVSSQQTLHSVESLALPDSPLGQALLEMRDAARSLKDLSDSLERQPEAILYGK